MSDDGERDMTRRFSRRAVAGSSIVLLARLSTFASHAADLARKISSSAGWTRSKRDVLQRHADEGRWLARELPRRVSWVIVAITLLTAVAIQRIEGTYVPIVLGGAMLAVGLPIALLAELASRKVTVITIDGEWLTLTDAAQTRRHRLLRGSLRAVRWTNFGADDGMGTVLFVRLDEGAVVSIAIRSLLPDDRYAADVASRANLYLDRGGAVLLERVRPHVMPHEPKALPADLATTASPVASSYRATNASVTFSIPLDSHSKYSPRELAPACLYIVGDTVALGSAGNAELVAQAKASQIHVLCYRTGGFWQVSDEWRGDCISLLFRQEQRMLTTGVWGDLSPEVGDLLLNIGVWGDLSPEVGDLWRGPTPTGPAPHYVIGPAGLMKLLDVLRVLEKH